MPSYFILVPILLPVIVGILLLIFPIEDAKKRNICIEIVVVLNTILVHVLRWSGGLSVALGFIICL